MVQRSLGSGVLVDASGLIVTNYTSSRRQRRQDRARRQARIPSDVVLKDQRSDLAVLRIKGSSERFPTLEFAIPTSCRSARGVGDRRSVGVGQT